MMICYNLTEVEILMMVRHLFADVSRIDKPTQEHIDATMMLFLRNAMDRSGGREKRQERAAQNKATKLQENIAPDELE